jgi:hypothetical protein
MKPAMPVPLRRARFDSSAATKPTGGNGQGGQPFLAHDAERSAYDSGHRAPLLSTLTIAVVAGVTLLVVLLGLWQVLMLIVSYGD